MILLIIVWRYKIKSIVNYQNKKLYLELGRYSNGRLAILLNDANGELWDDLTINLPNKHLEENCIFINPGIQNYLLNKLCKTGVFLNLHRKEDFEYRILMVNRDLLKKYANDYRIEMWESEEDRNQGFVTIYNEHFGTLEDALEEARYLYDDGVVASIMILNNDESIYCRDKETFETFYLNNDEFSKIPQETLEEYIDNCMDSKELPINVKKMYSEKIGGGYIAVDNSTGECYVEEFDNENQVHKWLLGKEKDEIIDKFDDEVSL